MQLSLNGWPPVASHLACLLVGVSCANVAWKEPPPRPKLPPRTLTLTVASPKGQAADAEATRPGTRVHVVRIAAPIPCRVTADPLLVIEAAQTTSLAASLRQAAELPGLGRGLSSGELAVRPASDATPPCPSRPKVTYAKP
jgi:hypothetical protein